MPLEPNPSIWGSLLGVCRIHDPTQSGYYVLLSNIYVVKSRWDEVKKVRELTVGGGVNKMQGFSLIEFNNFVYKFGVGDRVILGDPCFLQCGQTPELPHLLTHIEDLSLVKCRRLYHCFIESNVGLSLEFGFKLGFLLLQGPSFLPPALKPWNSSPEAFPGRPGIFALLVEGTGIKRAQAWPTAAMTRALPDLQSSTVNGLPGSTWRLGLQGAGPVGWGAMTAPGSCSGASILALFSLGASFHVVSAGCCRTTVLGEVAGAGVDASAAAEDMEAGRIRSSTKGSGGTRSSTSKYQSPQILDRHGRSTPLYVFSFFRARRRARRMNNLLWSPQPRGGLNFHSDYVGFGKLDRLRVKPRGGSLGTRSDQMLNVG
ncbi:pentatricopeptide repeat-containing-like protein [Cinnamomum micranthum f. kanehirae]|uniref:Pentatricopeptide repeat-containing-like protein n=1 Tax=Cinnamomum micranthum f. kanehirae TaxID=337451 RepID=A0A443PCG6_9MAGN|nr:pentatricopeptide repeat-containing-like protein [Cinnamomum micranthum f. kanehirae]